MRSFVLSWFFAFLVAASLAAVALATYQSPHDKLRASIPWCQAGHSSWSTDVDAKDLNFTKAVFVDHGWSHVDERDLGRSREVRSFLREPPAFQVPQLTVTGLCFSGTVSSTSSEAA